MPSPTHFLAPTTAPKFRGKKRDMTQNNGKIAIIINNASYERVAFALNLAITQLAVFGRNVDLLFTYGALIRLKKGSTDQVGEETEHWIREQIKHGIKKGAIPRISELLKDLKKMGGRIYACTGALALHSITQEELIDEVDSIRGTTGFLCDEDAKNTPSIIHV
jgi:peroxiredoxin family protein